MAKIRSGVLGVARGKVAGVVGSVWKGRNYLREHVIPANPQTAGQMEQRARFRACVAFAQQILGPVLQQYQDPLVRGMSAFNYFIRHNVAQFADPVLLSNIVITRGSLHTPLIGNVSWEGSGNTEIEFSDEVGPNGLPDDQVVAVVYSGDSKRAYFSTPVDRSAGVVMVPSDMDADPTIAAYFTFAFRQEGGRVVMLSMSSMSGSASMPR